MVSFEIEHQEVLIIGRYDEKSGEIGIEDVVNPDTGEVLTDEWFEEGYIYNRDLKDKIKDEANDQVIDDFLSDL